VTLKIVLLLAGAASACNRPHNGEVTPGAFVALPDVPGFSASAVAPQGSAVHRSYTRGAARVTVTLARLPMSAEGYATWVETSTAGFPQAALDLPAGSGNGFYQCDGGTDPSCDLLIQLRSGVHLELRGSGTSRRRDVDELARGLPLRTLAAAVPALVAPPRAGPE
jgi:hypothetical protein